MMSLTSRLIMSLTVSLVSFGFTLPTKAFPIVAEECRNDAVACAKSGKLDVISIYGIIGREDRTFFEAIDQVIPDDKPFPKIYLNSEGGLANEAITIGRILRKRNATALSGSPFFVDYFVECSSACTFIAAGATTRQLDHIGLHSGYISVYNGPRAWHDDPLTPEILDIDFKYLDEMGINPEMKDIIKATPSDNMANFYFDPRADLEGQKIIELGFRMLGGPPTTLPTMPIYLPDVYKAREERLKNAVEYGFVSAIPHAVQESLKTSSGKPIDYKTGNYWLELGAKQDHVWSLYNLGVNYQFGRGVKTDLKKSAELYLRAAQLGMGPAQNNIGWNYYKAIGVKRSIPEAVFWISRAAEHGEPFAYGSLCEMYDAGDVFEHNDIEAYKWCKLSVDQEPKGHARDNDSKILSKYRKKLSLSDLDIAETLTRKWSPLQETRYPNVADTDNE